MNKLICANEGDFGGNIRSIRDLFLVCTQILPMGYIASRKNNKRGETIIMTTSLVGDEVEFL